MTANAQTQVTDTRIGKLSFENGYPSDETARKLFDEMDYQRAVQAYLWAYPVVSFESIRLGTKRDLGADLNDLVIADNYADPKGLWLTANGLRPCRTKVQFTGASRIWLSTSTMDSSMGFPSPTGAVASCWGRARR